MDKFTLPTYKASYGFSLLLLGVVCSNVIVAIYIRMYSVIKISVTFLRRCPCLSLEYGAIRYVQLGKSFNVSDNLY